MSSIVYQTSIDELEIKTQDTIIVDWDVDTIAAFTAVLSKAVTLNGFDLIAFQRQGVELFNGRIEKPRISFGRQGTPMPISGFDWTAILRDYTTISQSIIDSTTAVALAAIVSEITDITLTVTTSGVFEYITALENWDSWIDFCITLDNIVDGGVALDLSSTVEISQEVDAGTYTICNVGLKGAFMYDGATHRLYIFARDAANNIYYFHSTDGLSWTAVDSGVNSTSDAWSVGWSGSNVYLFVYDGANTDFERGTITDATGAIAWASVGNIFADEIRFGPVFDDDFHVWVIRNNAGGQAYESTDAGATWNNRFGPGANELWAIGQVGSDGDMTGIALDTGNNDLEEWTWDRSASTFTFTGKIMNEDDVDGMDLCQDLALNIYIAYNDFTEVFIVSNQSGSWDDDGGTIYAGFNNLSIGSDSRNMYLYLSYGGGVECHQYYNDTLLDSWSNDDASVSTPAFITCPRGYMQDGKYAIFSATIDNGNDVHVIIHSQEGVRIGEGSLTARFTTNTVTASGGFVSWGILTAEGVGISNGVDVLWDIENAVGPFQTLIDDETAPFDLDLAGVDPSLTSIVIECNLEDNGTDPIVSEFDITEKTDSVSIDTNHEDSYTGIKKLADLAGAEFWVVRAEDGTFTLFFSTRRGEDKSDSIVLKTANSGARPDVIPNIKVVSRTYDWSSYANVVKVVGPLDGDGNQIISVVRDNEQIAEMDKEYWFTLTDGDVPDTGMARQRAYQELTKRNSVKLRTLVDFLDKYDTGQIEIGDSVTLIAEWDGVYLINGSTRNIKLRREWGFPGGEKVSGEFTEKLKDATYWNYQKKTEDTSRWTLQT